MIYIAFDTETTGIEPGSRLVELAAVAFSGFGEVAGTFSRFVHPGMPIPPDASAANAITDEQLVDSAGADVVLREFFAWLPADPVLIAHNAPFDQDILGWECGRAGLAQPQVLVIDTLQMAKSVGGTPDHKLQTLVKAYGISIEGDAHRALPDAHAVRQLFVILSKRVQPVLNPWQSRHVYTVDLPAMLHGLPQAISRTASVAFTYIDATGDQSRRSITPYGWASTKNGLAIHGLCHLRRERRMFMAQRMADVTIGLE